MLNRVLSNNRVFGAVVCALVFIAAGLLYIQSAKRKVARDVPPLRETAKPQQSPQTGKQSPETSQGGHWHADGTYHAEPHEAPVLVEGEDATEVKTPATQSNDTLPGALSKPTPKKERAEPKAEPHPGLADASHLPDASDFPDDPLAAEIAKNVKIIVERHPIREGDVAYYKAASEISKLKGVLYRSDFPPERREMLYSLTDPYHALYIDLEAERKRIKEIVEKQTERALREVRERRERSNQ